MINEYLNKEEQRQLIKSICIAIETGDLETTKILLDKGGDLINADEDGNIPARSLYRDLLMVAVDANQPDVANYLIDKGVDLNHKIWWTHGGKKSARDFAKETTLKDVVLHIDQKLSTSQQLFVAVCEGDVAKLENLLDKGVEYRHEVDLYGDPLSGCAGYSLLMIAIKHEQSEIAKSLLSRGVDIHFKHQEWDRPDIDSDPILVESVTARDLATQNGLLDVVRMIDSLDTVTEKNQDELPSVSKHVVYHENDDVTDLNHNGSQNSRIVQRSEHRQSGKGSRKELLSCICDIL